MLTGRCTSGGPGSKWTPLATATPSSARSGPATSASASASRSCPTRIPLSEAPSKCDDTPENQAEPGDPADRATGRQQLLEQHERGDGGHPGQVHHAAHEEQRHEHPAAAQAEEPMAQPHHQRAQVAVAPLGEQEAERRLATRQARVLERRELVDAGGDEHGGADDGHDGPRIVGQQRRRLESPLRGRCRQAEPAPDQEITEREEPGADERWGPPDGVIGPALAVDGGEDEEHGGRAGQHHGRHHDRPHRRGERCVGEGPGLHVGHAHRRHAFHLLAEPKEVEPGQRHDAGEPGQRERSLATRHRLDPAIQPGHSSSCSTRSVRRYVSTRRAEPAPARGLGARSGDAGAEIDGADGGAKSADDVVHRLPVVAFAREHAEGGVRNPVARRVSLVAGEIAREEPRMQTVRIGHSPDPDDAFMFYALTAGKVPIPGVHIEHVLEDIESLNRRARAAELEVTAVSAATYALVADRYRLMDPGASMGKGYGPILVAREPIDPKEIPERVVAIPGSHTTAALLLRLYVPEEPPLIQVAFDKIPQAVLEGQADLGLLIHEGQITHQQMGLVKVLDLGQASARYTPLPLALRVDVMRRDLGGAMHLALSQALRASIGWGDAHVDEALEYALRYGRGIDKETCRRFVLMYVNDYTLALGQNGRAAIERLFEMAQAKGLVAEIPPLDPI